MSSGELAFPYTPEQVTSGLGEYKPPEEMDHNDNYNLFWESEPTGVWQDKVSQTIGAIDNGADVVMISSRFGTGKTFQYGRLLQRHYELYMNGFYEAVQLTPEEHSSRKWALEHLDDTPVVIIDEMTGEVGEHEDRAQDMLRVFVGQKPLVLIYPGINSSRRRTAVEKTKGIISADYPESKIVDLGDVPATYVDTQRGAYLLDVIGFESTAIEFFTDVAALRAPRLFEAVSEAMRSFTPKTLTRDALQRHLHFFIETKTRQKLSSEDYHVGFNIWEKLVGPNSHILLGSHGPFLTGSLTTHDAIEIYQSLGLPPPDRDEIPTFDDSDFDPYNKN